MSVVERKLILYLSGGGFPVGNKDNLLFALTHGTVSRRRQVMHAEVACQTEAQCVMNVVFSGLLDILTTKANQNEFAEVGGGAEVVMSRRRTNHSRIREESESMRFDEGNVDSCPHLGEEDEAISPTQNQQIRSVRPIDNGVLATKKSFVQRFRSRRNRFIQRALVVLHLAEPSRDQTFNQAQINNRTAIAQLATIRSGLFAHSQSIVNLSMAICCFNGNSARFHQVVRTSVVVEGHKIRECSLVFAGQVENSVLAKIDRRIDDLERIDTLIEERTKIVLELEYAKRVLSVEKQKGNVNHVAQHERQLQAAQQECEQATRFIAEQLKFSSSKPGLDPGEVLQEYAQLTAQFFKRGAGFLDSVTTPQN